MTTEAASRERRGFFLALLGVAATLACGASAEAMEAARLDITVFDEVFDYGQIIIADPGARPPLDLWSDQAESDQGFSWTPGTVAFGVPDVDGSCRVVVGAASRVSFRTDALWALRVPFTVPASGKIEVGPVLRERRVAVLPGRYSLIFEALPGGRDHALVLRLTFCDDVRPDWQILKRGTELKTDRVLRRQAKPG